MSLEQDVIEKLQAILDEYREAKQRELDAMQCPFTEGEVVIYDNPHSQLFPVPAKVKVKVINADGPRDVCIEGLYGDPKRSAVVPIEFLKKVNP